MKEKRITIFTGHYGSGKTETAINYAVRLKERHESVIIVDLDIVNPYFRTKDAETVLNNLGIKVIAPTFANTNLDLPSLPASISSVFEDKSAYVVFDVGGDDDGATALGRYNRELSREDYDMFFVLNERRPIMQDVSDCISMLRGIENNSRLKVNGIINNTHVGSFTEVKDILRGQKHAEEVAEKCDLDVTYIAGVQDVLKKLPEELKPLVFSMDLYIKMPL